MCPGQEMMLLKEVKQDHHDIKKRGRLVEGNNRIND